MTDFCQRKMSRTRRRRRSCPWRILSASNENLAIENLEIVFLQVLDSAEEDGFGFGKSRVVRKLFARQLKGADDVGYLEKAIFGGFDIRRVLGVGARGEDGKGLFDETCQCRLSVVIIDLQLIIVVEIIRMGKQKALHLSQQRVMDVLGFSKEILVDAETLAGNVNLAEEGHHPVEDTAPCFTRHGSVILLATNQRPCVDTMVAVKPHACERIAEFLKLFQKIDVLVVKDQTNHVEARRSRVRFKAARFVDEDADLFRSSAHVQNTEKTKARISPRLRQETFPLAGDAGFRLCRNELYHNSLGRRKGQISHIAE